MEAIIRLPAVRFVALLFVGAASTVCLAADLSKYRDFELGADLASIAKQIGADPSQAKRIHSRPLIIQQLNWRPRSLGATSQSEAVQEVVFSFLDGKLYRAAIEYDRYETNGMTEDDVIAAISKVYGKVSRLADPGPAAYGAYGNPQQILATWEDKRHSFNLLRSSYGPSFKLVGVERSLESKAIAAIAEAERLDTKEAPEREAARILDEEDAAKAKLDNARDLNKPKFRP
jgi:hypothetical protein